MATAPAMYLPCKICDRGSLIAKKVYKMSTPVVFIGFVLLVPSVLGMLFSFFLFMTAANKTTSNEKKSVSDIAGDLRRAQVPEQVIDAIIDSAQLHSTNRENDLQTVKDWVAARQEPMPLQREAIMQALKDIEESATNEPKVDSGANGLVGGIAIFMGIGSMVAGLLGWLLVMKKRILQCGTCGAVVIAS